MYVANLDNWFIYILHKKIVQRSAQLIDLKHRYDPDIKTHQYKAKTNHRTKARISRIPTIPGKD